MSKKRAAELEARGPTEETPMTTEPTRHAINVPDKNVQGCLFASVVMGLLVAGAAMWGVIQFFVAVFK